MANNAGAFAKIAAASATGGGNNIRDGIYKLAVEKVFMQDGHSGQCFIAEFRVLESTPNGATDERGNAIVPNAVGSTCSIVCNLTKHASAPGNAKAFLIAALAGLGIPEAKVTADVMGEACDETTNPVRGIVVSDETYRTVNKGRDNPANAGKALTLNKWKAVGQTQEDVAKMRAYLDSNAAKADVVPPTPAATFAQPAAVTQPVAAAVTEPAPAPAPAKVGLLGGILGGK